MSAPIADASGRELHEAQWWQREADGRLRCNLCPRHCRIGEGQHGYCLIRANRGGRLYSLAYAAPAAVQVDPIEKKPLHHFLPGTRVLSLGTAGCSLGCSFCQNWDLVRSAERQTHARMLTPEEVVQLAAHEGCPSIAFTYNEPTVWGEYVMDISRIARLHGIKTILVTNGFITREAFHDLYRHIDAANVDLKAFTEDFYRRQTLAHLQPILETLRWIHFETPVWLEITHLMIPGLNDDPLETRRLANWVRANLGPDIPVHFTAFHPDYKLAHRPETPPETLRDARAIARQAGLRFAYEGNVVSEGLDTYCPDCRALLIKRSQRGTFDNRLRNGECPNCDRPIPGRWAEAQEFTLPHRPHAAGHGPHDKPATHGPPWRKPCG
jgi:pyruvate formate lyase activating enzyme